MCEHTDTKELNYDSFHPEPSKPPKRKNFFITYLPLLLALLGIVSVFTVFVMAVKAKQDRLARSGTMGVKYIGDARAVEATESGVLRPMPLLNRVIFRLDGVEVFRFTYEGGRGGQNFSFEVMEGSQ